jgi:hypothetical protein
VDSSTVHDVEFNDPANGLVGIQDEAFFSLANSLSQIVNDELSVCSKFDIFDNSNRAFGISKFKGLQFFIPANLSMEGEL